MEFELLTLIAEAMLIYAIVLWAHSLRHRFGPAHFYALIGGLTAVMSWVTDAGVAVHVGNITFVIGSTVFYSALLLSVFVVYVFDGPRSTRIAISTIIAVSIFVPLSEAILHFQAQFIGISNIGQVPIPDMRINTASVSATLIDLIFLAMAWEFLGKPALNLQLWFRTYATLLGVMWLDVFLFASGAFAGTPGFLTIMGGTLISRFVISLLSFPLLYAYLAWQNHRGGSPIENRPILAILRQVAETESAILRLRQEMEKRKQAEKALRKSEALLEETGRMACVGGWELEVTSGEMTWTRQTYRIHEVSEKQKPMHKEALNFFHPSDRKKLVHAIDRAIQDGKPYDLELQFQTASGRDLWVRNIGKPVQSAGKTVRLMGALQDITERKMIETALARHRDHLEEKVAERTFQVSDAKRQWEVTFDAISDWVAIIDKNHCIIRSNMAAKNIVGMSPAEIIGKNCHTVMHKTKSPVPDCPLGKSLGSKRRESTEFQTESGRWLQVVVDPIENDGANGRFVHIARDISDVKNRENETIESRKAEAFSILSGGIAHDYNNLLAVIWGNISLLKEEIPNHLQTREIIGDAEKACEQARVLTHQFLTLSRGGALVKTRLRLTALLTSIIAETANIRRINLSVKMPKQLPEFEIDPALLGIAIQNILRNAIEAMPNGGRLEICGEIASITRADQTKGKQLELIFKDNGRGIAESDLHRVFDPYFSTHEMGRRKGMGLGLAVARSVIMKHGGDISIDSRLGAGTSVRVTLPFSAPAIGHEWMLPRASARPIVMVMEDNPPIRKMLAEMLRRVNCEAITTCHGEETVERYESAIKNNLTIDLILLDQNITGGTGGVETLKMLKERGYEKSTILITGSPNSPAITDYKNFGFDGKLLKPFTKKELKKVVHRFI